MYCLVSHHGLTRMGPTPFSFLFFISSSPFSMSASFHRESHRLAVGVGRLPGASAPSSPYFLLLQPPPTASFCSRHALVVGCILARPPPPATVLSSSRSSSHRFRTLVTPYVELSLPCARPPPPSTPSSCNIVFIGTHAELGLPYALSGMPKRAPPRRACRPWLRAYTFGQWRGSRRRCCKRRTGMLPTVAEVASNVVMCCYMRDCVLGILPPHVPRIIDIGIFFLL
jgi:hypothetical protein